MIRVQTCEGFTQVDADKLILELLSALAWAEQAEAVTTFGNWCTAPLNIGNGPMGVIGDGHFDDVQQGPDLHVYGSANLVQTLMKHDLVDEFWLKIYPLTLGSGKRLFVDGTIPAAFKVTESTVTPKGIIFVNYERAGAITTGRL